MINNRNFKIIQRLGKQKPVLMDLSGDQGSRIVMNAARKVLKTHQKVIKALANR
jgi:hypothetical protein